MVEDRRTLGRADSIEEAERLFIDDFDTRDMTGYYLYSKLLRSGVSAHIGTWGSRATATDIHFDVMRIDLCRWAFFHCGRTISKPWISDSSHPEFELAVQLKWTAIFLGAISTNDAVSANDSQRLLG
jgi:hypothetical protein